MTSSAVFVTSALLPASMSMGNWNTSGEVLHEQKEGEETTALPHPPVQQRVVTLRQDLLHPPKMSQFLGLNEEVQQRVDNDSDNVDNEKIVKPKEKPLPFSGTKIPIEIIPLDVWKLVLGNIISSSLLKTRLVCKQFRRISDEILKSTTKKCRRNVFASIHPFAKLTTSYSSSFGVLRNTKEIAVALKHEVLAYDVKAKTTRPLVVGKEPMCDHLKAIDVTPSGRIVTLSINSTTDSYFLRVYEPEDKDERQWKQLLEYKFEDEAWKSDRGATKIVFAVGENIAALANLDTHSVTVVRFCSPSTPSSSASIPSVSKIREMALLLHITSRDEICIGYDKSLETGAPQIIVCYSALPAANGQHSVLWKHEIFARLFRYHSPSFIVDDFRNIYITDSHRVRVFDRDSKQTMEVNCDRMMKREPRVKCMRLRYDGVLLLQFEDQAFFAITDD